MTLIDHVAIAMLFVGHLVIWRMLAHAQRGAVLAFMRASRGSASIPGGWVRSSVLARAFGQSIYPVLRALESKGLIESGDMTQYGEKVHLYRYVME